MNLSLLAPIRVAGVDFTSRPRRAKPHTVALGWRRSEEVHLESLQVHAGFDGLADWLRAPGPWVAAFDFPFGLPRALVESLGWPTPWPELMRHYAALSRREIRDTFAAFCAARPAGSKFAHRACDGPAGSSPSMKWVNPPVAYMLHAGVPLLIEAGVHIPALHAGDPTRVALEGYPGLLARELVGRRSYKSDDRIRQTAERADARAAIVDALEAGRSRLGLTLRIDRHEREALVADPSADRLDAVLCLMQAAWAATQPRYGMPHDVDPIEGWIVTTPARSGETVPPDRERRPPRQREEISERN